MKRTLRKSIITLTFVLAGILFSNAQELGVRFGNMNAGNVAIDGVLSTGDFSRVHADLGFGGNGVEFDLLWDFLYFPIGSDEFKWYLGAGPYLGIFNKADGESGTEDNQFNLGAVFEIGVEYRFDAIPIVLGVDYRPALAIIDEVEFIPKGFGLNIRYLFHY